MTPFSYLDHVSNAASVSAFREDTDVESLMSAETVTENESLIDFATFARENPKRLMQLLSGLRIEFRELFIEYYILGKSQSFLAKTHAMIQTRIWQTLRIIEQAIGARIVLGNTITTKTLQPILQSAGLDATPYGSLAVMIQMYARNQSYSWVADRVGAPTPAIRKLFRPAIKTLLASKDLKQAAVGCYLRAVTHQASLTSNGLSERCLARLKYIREMHFDAPSLNDSALISYGAVEKLQNVPWNMFEVSSDHRVLKILPTISKSVKQLFGKQPGQVFAPVDQNGDLKLGYILARTVGPISARRLTTIRGVSEMSARYDGDGVLTSVVEVPATEVLPLIAAHSTQNARNNLRIGEYVCVLSGEAKGYCGVLKQGGVVQIEFPSQRRFIVYAENGSLRRIGGRAARNNFWGVIGLE